MESTIVNNNNMINKKDELIKELKSNNKVDTAAETK
jgi:hypothetical protein